MGLGSGKRMKPTAGNGYPSLSAVYHTMNLNPDVYPLILDHIADTESLYVLLSVLPPSHPYFRLTLIRRLCLPILITCDIIPSKTHYLIDLLQLSSASFVRELDIRSTPSPATYHDFHRKHLWTDELTKEYERIPHRMPDLFANCSNLRKVRWRQCIDIPHSVFEALSKLDRMKTASVDCSSIASQEGDSWHVQPFLTCLGPQLTSLELLMVDEEAFKSFQTTFPLLTSLTSLTLDITHGSWDWIGPGSPQQGPSDSYVFKPLGGSNRLRRLKLNVNDLTMRPQGGPINLVNPVSLLELYLEVFHCYGWTSCRRMKAFQRPIGDFSILTHLSITDQARNALREKWQDELPRGQNGEIHDHIEEGRIYYGLLEFISQLKSLKRLWVDERVLCVLNLDDVDPGSDEAWQCLSPFHTAQASMESPVWIKLIKSGVLQGLESLRVGLGPLNATSIGTLLRAVQRDRLVEFGFEWNWKEFGKDKPISSSLVDHLRSMTNLRDVHLIFPRPETSDQTEDEYTLCDVNAIFDACPSICRVGVGRKCVWERKTPVETSSMERIQLMDQELISDFYDVGRKRRGWRASLAESKAEREVERLSDFLELASEGTTEQGHHNQMVEGFEVLTIVP